MHRNRASRPSSSSGNQQQGGTDLLGYVTQEGSGRHRHRDPVTFVTDGSGFRWRILEGLRTILRSSGNNRIVRIAAERD